METVKLYTLDELSLNKDEPKIILQTADDMQIGIEKHKDGTRLYLYFGGKIKKRGFDYVVLPRAKKLN